MTEQRSMELTPASMVGLEQSPSRRSSMEYPDQNRPRSCSRDSYQSRPRSMSTEYYVELENNCRQEAGERREAIQSSANDMCCPLASPRSRRRGDFLLKQSPRMERYILEGIQEKSYERLWEEARKAVYGL